MRETCQGVSVDAIDRLQRFKIDFADVHCSCCHRNGCPDLHGGERDWQPVLRELVQAMRDYEMDVDDSPPQKHRDMMERAEQLLAGHGGERADRIGDEEIAPGMPLTSAPTSEWAIYWQRRAERAEQRNEELRTEGRERPPHPHTRGEPMNTHEQLTLGQLIDELKRADPEQVCAEGFDRAHSYRGDYSLLAFRPANNVTVGTMLAVAEGALTKTFCGWKGGEYRMDRETAVHLVDNGDYTGHDELTRGMLAYMLCREHRPCPNCGRA